MLTIPHCKESLSRAYITAVVGCSRNSLVWGREFDYAVDGSVKQLEKRGSRIRESGFGFDFQTKSTVDWWVEDAEIVYDLEAKAYNDLVARAGSGASPFFLILLCLPRDEGGWLAVSPEQLILQKCAYWYKPTGEPTDNAKTQRIRIPAENLLTPESITRFLTDIQKGDLLP